MESMKKIIPIISLLGAVIATVMSVTALVLLSCCVADPELAGVAVFTIPLLIASTVAAALATFVNFMFIRDTLCRAGFIIGLIGLLSTIAGYILIMSI